MKGKKLKIILYIMLIIAISGCTREIKYSELTGENALKFVDESGTVPRKLENVEETKKKLLEEMNNKKSADQLIKTIYPHEFMQNMIPQSITMTLAQMPPECIRTGKEPRYMYFVYKSNTGHYAVCEILLEDEQLGISRRMYYDSPRYLEDFEKLKDAGADWKDVMEFDPYGWYTYFYTGYRPERLYSAHEVFDGYMIRVYYEDNEERNTLVVSEIVIDSGKENTIFYNLPQTDQEMILKSLG